MQFSEITLKSFLIKALIYLGSTFVIGFLNFLMGRYLGFRLGWLPRVVIELFVSYLLCKEYDNRRSRRKSEACTASVADNDVSVTVPKEKR